MLYTRKGDKGDTKLFSSSSGVRIKKSAPIFEALGTIDEINSFLGYTKIVCRNQGVYSYRKKGKITYEEILEKIQQMLFSIQAELGGSKKFVTEAHIQYLEETIAEIEIVLPPITSFIIPGGGEVGGLLDVARTIVRRGERQVVGLVEIEKIEIAPTTLIFLNRLSSVMYAMARFANYQQGHIEKSPTYL